MVETNDQRTALTMACEKGFHDIMEVLMNAIEERHGKEELSRLLSMETTSKETLLYLACGGGNPEIVKLLLAEKSGQKAARIATLSGDLPLHKAAANGHLEVVELLLDLSDLMAKDNSKESAIFKAAKGGHVEVVEALVTAIRKNHGEEEAEDAINSKNSTGSTPLVAASSSKRLDVIKVRFNWLSISGKDSTNKKHSFW